MSCDDILKHMYHPNTTLHEVRTCDPPTASDKMTHYSAEAEELHCVTSCQKIKNYKQLVKATQEIHYVDQEESPLSLDNYSTLRKSNCGKAIDRTQYRYLGKSMLISDLATPLQSGEHATVSYL